MGTPPDTERRVFRFNVSSHRPPLPNHGARTRGRRHHALRGMRLDRRRRQRQQQQQHGHLRCHEDEGHVGDSTRSCGSLKVSKAFEACSLAFPGLVSCCLLVPRHHAQHHDVAQPHGVQRLQDHRVLQVCSSRMTIEQQHALSCSHRDGSATPRRSSPLSTNSCTACARHCALRSKQLRAGRGSSEVPS